MFNRIIVPIDGSDASWRAVPVAERLAAACDADLELLHIDTSAETDSDRPAERIRRRVDDMAWSGPAPRLTIVRDRLDVAHAIADHLDASTGAQLVMAGSGKGRTQAVLGSVSAEVLTATFGPVIIVGPHVDADASFAGSDLMITVDGSELSETALGLAGAWGIGMQLRPWVVSVLEPETGADRPRDAAESNYVSRLAQRLERHTRRDTEFEVLHGKRPASAIAEFAETLNARFVVMATHGRGGLARLTLGSVAADVVRHSPCPVVLLRPPHQALHHDPADRAGAMV